MIRSEWIDVVKLMRVNWPHAQVTEASIAKWYADLEHLPILQVTVAVEAIYRDGREFPPNGAQILAKISELDRDHPDHGEAWELVRKALFKYGIHDWSGFYASLAEQSPAVAEAARRYGFEPSGYQLSEESTVRAQFRDIYKAVCAEGKRDDAYAGLPGAGLRGLERGPRRLGAALKRALPRGPA